MGKCFNRFNGEFRPDSGFNLGGTIPIPFCCLSVDCLKIEIKHMENLSKNRRRAPRALLSLPIRIRCFDSHWTEEIARTSNVSRGGLYFETSARHYLDQGFRSRKLSVVRNFQLGDIANLEESGRIVRIDHLLDGKLGVAIHIPLREEPEYTKALERSSGNK